jgi:hypothetical protein
MTISMKPRVRRYLSLTLHIYLWGVFRTPQSKRPYILAANIRSLEESIAKQAHKSKPVGTPLTRPRASDTIAFPVWGSAG